MKKSYPEQIVDRLIEQLEVGTAPWQKPWEPGELTLPYNPTTGAEYKGSNSLWLTMQGRSDPRWMTYKQAQGIDAQVSKGEKGTMIQYWKFHDNVVQRDSGGKPIQDAGGKSVTVSEKLSRPRVFNATVFNAEQINGLPQLEAPATSNEWERHERADALLKASGAVLNHDQADTAFYRLTTDTIHLPQESQFSNADKYYRVALHELGHWTGHKSRLDRDLSGAFGSESYAKEELRAEISSLMVNSEIGVGHDIGQHAAYVESWIKVLKDDPTEILRAARDADKIRGFVLNLEKQTERTLSSSEIIDLAEKYSEGLNDTDKKWFMAGVQARIDKQKLGKEVDQLKREPELQQGPER